MTPTDRPRVLFSLTLLARNGVATHLKTLSRGLRERDWDVGIAAGAVTDDTPVSEDFMAEHGISYFRVPYPDFVRSSKSPRQALEAMAALHRVVRRFRPGVMHTLGLGITPFVYPMRLLHGVPLVSSCRNEPLPRVKALAQRYAPLLPLLNPVFGNRVIAISQELDQVLRELWKVPPRRIRLVPNGIDDARFRPPSPDERKRARASFGLSPEQPAVCLVGRLSWVKGHHVFVRALARLARRGRSVVGLCAGEGRLKEKIEAQAAELGVADRVRLLGHTDARRVYWASDVCALPSRREGFPNVIAEAMLCGTVPVRTPAGGVEDQVEDGVHGFIVPFDDPEALADRIETLLEDDARRRCMSERARCRALERFTASVMVKDTIAVYREVGA